MLCQDDKVSFDPPIAQNLIIGVGSAIGIPESSAVILNVMSTACADGVSPCVLMAGHKQVN